MKEAYKNFIKCVNHEIPDRIPFALWPTGPFVTWLAGRTQQEYYLDPEVKYQVLMYAVDRFPDAIFFPGIYPEFGAVFEPALFGSEILWHENDAPHALRLLDSIDDVDRVTVPRDIAHAGLMPEWVRQTEYFWKHLPEHYIEDYGFLDGLAYCLGPLETSATLMNYSEFLLQLCLEPEKIHRLLDVVTDGIIESLRFHEKYNGRIKRVVMADHMGHQVSAKMFAEFCAPYYKRIYDAFGSAQFRLLHNEGNMEHVASMFPEIGINLVHYGADTRVLQERTGGKVALMGNIRPLEIMLRSTPEVVYQDAMECMKYGARGGGQILSTAGGISYGTPAENIDAAIQASLDFDVKAYLAEGEQ